MRVPTKLLSSRHAFAMGRDAGHRTLVEMPADAAAPSSDRLAPLEWSLKGIDELRLALIEKHGSDSPGVRSLASSAVEVVRTMHHALDLRRDLCQAMIDGYRSIRTLPAGALDDAARWFAVGSSRAVSRRSRLASRQSSAGERRAGWSDVCVSLWRTMPSRARAPLLSCTLASPHRMLEVGARGRHRIRGQGCVHLDVLVTTTPTWVVSPQWLGRGPGR